MSNPIGLLAEDINIKCKNNIETLVKVEWKDIADIFQFENSKPYIILAGSNGGKTNMCYDIMMHKAKEATAIYYVSSTAASGATNLISKFPNAIRSSCTLPNLMSIWREIQTNTNAYYNVDNKNGSTNSSSTTSLAKIYNKLIQNAGLVEADVKWRANIIAAYPDAVKNNTKPINTMQTLIDIIGDYIGTTYYESKSKNVQNTNQNKAIDDDSQHIAEAFKQELFIRFIVNILQIKPEALHSATSATSLTRPEMNIISGFYSEKPKTMFILDDCTEALLSFANDTRTKTMGLDGNNQTTVSKAYEQFITSLLTRARHYNCMVIIFTHTLAIMSSTTKDNISTLLVSPSAISEFQRSRTFPELTINLFNSFGNKMTNNEKQFKYCFMCYDFKEHPNNLYITKADCHTSRDVIEFDELNMKYFDIYNKINSADNIQPIASTSNSDVNFTSVLKSNESDNDSDDNEDLSVSDSDETIM